MCSFPHVFVISLALETRVLFETRIGFEELPTMMFPQIVFSFREEARVTRCHEQFSTTTFLLSSEFTQLERRPDSTRCSPFPVNVAHQIARLLQRTRKTVEKSV